MRTRHYGLAIGSASQWVSSESILLCIVRSPSADVYLDFTISKATPTLQTELGYKMFIMFSTMDLVVLTTFSLYVHVLLSTEGGLLRSHTSISYRLIPKMKGRSLEEMDIIFGVVQEGKQRADIAAQECGTSFILRSAMFYSARDLIERLALQHDIYSPDSDLGGSGEHNMKV